MRSGRGWWRSRRVCGVPGAHRSGARAQGSRLCHCGARGLGGGCGRAVHRHPILNLTCRRRSSPARLFAYANGACANVCCMTSRLPVRKAILERRTYEAPAEGRDGKVRLDFNENTSGCPAAVIRALGRMSPQQIAMYPEYQRSTAHLARYFGVRPNELLLTNGGDDALRVFFDTFVEPESRILICEPTFPMYRYYGEI